MKIFADRQHSEWDRYTMEHEPIASIDLMERAAHRLSDALCRYVPQGAKLTFFVGKGNNGGDGLAMARLLSCRGYVCRVVLLMPDSLNDNCRINLGRLPQSVAVGYDLYSIGSNDEILVDAILGSGFVGEASREILEAVHYINSLPNYTVSIDLPSAMHAEFGNRYADVVHADLTLTIESPKLAFVLPEAGDACGTIEIVSIGLNDSFADIAPTPYHYTDEAYIESISAPRRDKFSHKGDYGHTLLVCGSKGMAGAAFLAAGAALRSGCGYVTVALPDSYTAALAAVYPSALTIGQESDFFCHIPDRLDRYTSIAVGCGLGRRPELAATVERLFEAYRKPMVIDADAINLLAEYPALQRLLPKDSILTPHDGELVRLVGRWTSQREKIESVVRFAKELSVVVVSKGAHTMVCLPDGTLWFNSTGNPFMAKAGSGDVLTGLLAGLVARGYTPQDAARIGVYHHGLAGDMAAAGISGESFCSNDLIPLIKL